MCARANTFAVMFLFILFEFRGETIAAEDVLHDMGAVSIMSSDSQVLLISGFCGIILFSFCYSPLVPTGHGKNRRGCITYLATGT